MQKNIDKRSGQYRLVSNVTQEMYDELIALLSGTNFQSLSELCRHIINGKRIEATFYGSHPDKLLSDLTSTNKEFQQKCSEINEITKIVHGEQSPEVLMRYAKQAWQLFAEVDELLGPVQELITSISKRWTLEE